MRTKRMNRQLCFWNFASLLKYWQRRFSIKTPVQKACGLRRSLSRLVPNFPYRRGLLALTLLMPTTAMAGPAGEQVVAGTAAVTRPNATTTQISQQTSKAIINWQNFSIAGPELVRFQQPGAGSIALNRVVGPDPSQIFGRLEANGQVFLVNPSGVLFAPGSQVSVHGLLATTHDINNDDFMAGRYSFGRTANPYGAEVVNQGTLQANDGGYIVLAGDYTANSGVIQARLGKVALASGNRFTLDLDGDQLIGLAVDEASLAQRAGVENFGTLAADGGQVMMTARVATELASTVVNNTGLIQARSIDDLNGEIILQGNSTGIVSNSGNLDATNANGSGGRIDLSGVAVSLGGTIAADGTTQGGEIAITANGVSLAGRVSATGGTGQGGSIDIQSQTIALHNVYSTLDASGATGGTIREVAGHQITSSATYLATGTTGTGGHIDLSAPATKLLSAQLDASGATGGGQIRVGGEYQGGKNLLTDELPNAETLAISHGSVITADATQQGNGGTVILWSDLESALYPAVSAKGKNGGAGGFIELSSGDKLMWGGSANAGVGGQVLMDPKNIVIQDATAGNVQYNLILGYNYLNLPRMKSNTLDTLDIFGCSVFLSGTQLAVGARQDDGFDNVAAGSGAVYLFNNPFTSPSLSGIIGKGYTGAGNYDLTSLEASDNFGSGISLSGTQLAVGARGDGGFDNIAPSSGAVYLFNNPFSMPTLSGIIGKGYTGAGDYDVPTLVMGENFGISVSLSDMQLAVGAVYNNGFDNIAPSSGAVYLFDTPFSTPSLSGIIGKGYTGAGNYDLTALEASDNFGSGVSLSGTQLVVGAKYDDGFDNITPNSGAVYLFDTPFSTPSLSGIIGKGYTGTGDYDLTALEASDNFGKAVSLSGTQLAATAYYDGGFGNVTPGSGAVYLFNTPFSTPTLSGIIGKGYTGAGDYDLTALETNDNFGSGVSLSGTQLAVGARYDDGFGNTAADSGAVYLFSNPFTTPSLFGIIGKGYTGTGNFDLAALEAGDYFGSAVSLSGTQLAVGARGDGGFDNIAPSSGAVYLFNNPFTVPSLSGIIGKGYTGVGNYDLTVLEANDYFGKGVSLSGTQLVVGADGDDGFGNVATNSGAVYLFNNPFSAPTLSGTIGKGYTGAGDYDVSALEANDHFGFSVSLSGTQLAVGAYYDDGFGNLTLNSGAVYLLSNPFSAPSLSGIIGKGYTGAGDYDLSALDVDDMFGSSVTLSDTQLAVGARWDDGFGNLVGNSGAAYLFNNPFNTPTLSGIIGKGYTNAGDYDLTTLEVDDELGFSISLSGTQLAVGAWGDQGFGNTAVNSGAVYLFNNPFTAPSLSGIIGKSYIGAGNFDVTALEAGDRFGSSVSLSSTQLVVGARGEGGFDNIAPSSGAVYLFNNPISTPTLAGIIGKEYTSTGNFDPGNALEALDGFGSAVSLSGTQLAVGAFNDGGFGNVAAGIGAVYLLNNPFSTPSLSGIIGKGYTGAGNYDVTTLEMDDGFGNSVSLSGTQLAVGAYADDGSGNIAADSGAVYLFNTPFSTPSLSGIIGKGYIGAGNYDVTALEAIDYFSSSAVSLSGTQLAVGASGDDGSGNIAAQSGAVYLFNNPFSTPSLSGIIGKGYTGAGNYDVTALEANDWFGHSVSLSGTQLAVGATSDGGVGNVAANTGAVYLFNNPFNTPTLSGIIGKGYTGAGDYDLTALESNDLFGWSVSLSGMQLAVGAYADDGFGNVVTNSGAVYLLNNPFSTPSLSGIIGKGYTGAGDYDLTALEADDSLGGSVSLSGTQLAVGAWTDDGSDNVATNSGAVYLFTLTPGLGSDPASGQTFTTDAGEDSSISPASITAILNTGSALTLQASNDITVNNTIASDNPSGDGGALTMQAGRSVLVNANITTDNGNLTLIANDTLANGVVDEYRDAGEAVVTVAAGTTIDTGNGALNIEMRDGAGLTNNTSGAITVADTAIVNMGSFSNLSAGPALDIFGTVNGNGIFDLTSLGDITINNLGSVYGANNSVMTITADSDSSGAGDLNVIGGSIIHGDGGGNVGSMTLSGYNIFLFAETESPSPVAEVIANDAATQNIIAQNTLELSAGYYGNEYSLIRASGGTQTISATSLLLQGGGPYAGSPGSYAAIVSEDGNQNISATGISILGGSGENAYATISTIGDVAQSITVGAGGLTITGGSGNDAFAEIHQSAGPGSQTIAINNGGAVNIIGGNTLNTDGYAWASIFSHGSGLQTIDFTEGGSLTLLGGDGGIRNLAEIGNSGLANLSILGNPDITLYGGATGAAVNDSESNDAHIGSDSGSSVTIQANSLTLQGGDSVYGDASISGGAIFLDVLGTASLTGGTGISAAAAISSEGDQTISTNKLDIWGGNGANAEAYIETSGGQDITVGDGGLTITGGAGDNALAQIYQGPSGLDQTITIINGGAVTITGGDTYDTDGNNSYANIYSEGSGFQTINFTSGGSLTLTGGESGLGNYANIGNTGIASLSILGSPDILLYGGNTGTASNYNEGNFANIGSTSIGSVYIEAASLSLNGGYADYSAATIGGGIITLNVIGATDLTGGTGIGAIAAIGELGAATDITLTSGGDITLTGDGSGGGLAAIGSEGGNANVTIIGHSTITADYARIGDFTGQNIYGWGNVMMTAEGSFFSDPSSSLSGENISIYSTTGDITAAGAITSSFLQLSASAEGTVALNTDITANQVYLHGGTVAINGDVTTSSVWFNTDSITGAGSVSANSSLSFSSYSGGDLIIGAGGLIDPNNLGAIGSGKQFTSSNFSLLSDLDSSTIVNAPINLPSSDLSLSGGAVALNADLTANQIRLSGGTVALNGDVTTSYVRFDTDTITGTGAVSADDSLSFDNYSGGDLIIGAGGLIDPNKLGAVGSGKQFTAPWFDFNFSVFSGHSITISSPFNLPSSNFSLSGGAVALNADLTANQIRLSGGTVALNAGLTANYVGFNTDTITGTGTVSANDSLSFANYYPGGDLIIGAGGYAYADPGKLGAIGSGKQFTASWFDFNFSVDSGHSITVSSPINLPSANFYLSGGAVALNADLTANQIRLSGGTVALNADLTANYVGFNTDTITGTGTVSANDSLSFANYYSGGDLIIGAGGYAYVDPGKLGVIGSGKQFTASWFDFNFHTDQGHSIIVSDPINLPTSSFYLSGGTIALNADVTANYVGFNTDTITGTGAVSANNSIAFANDYFYGNDLIIGAEGYACVDPGKLGAIGSGKQFTASWFDFIFYTDQGHSIIVSDPINLPTSSFYLSGGTIALNADLTANKVGLYTNTITGTGAVSANNSISFAYDYYGNDLIIGAGGFIDPGKLGAIGSGKQFMAQEFNFVSEWNESSIIVSDPINLPSSNFNFSGGTVALNADLTANQVGFNTNSITGTGIVSANNSISFSNYSSYSEGDLIIGAGGFIDPGKLGAIGSGKQFMAPGFSISASLGWDWWWGWYQYSSIVVNDPINLPSSSLSLSGGAVALNANVTARDIDIESSYDISLASSPYFFWGLWGYNSPISSKARGNLIQAQGVILSSTGPGSITVSANNISAGVGTLASTDTGPISYLATGTTTVASNQLATAGTKTVTGTYTGEVVAADPLPEPPLPPPVLDETPPAMDQTPPATEQTLAEIIETVQTVVVASLVLPPQTVPIDSGIQLPASQATQEPDAQPYTPASSPEANTLAATDSSEESEENKAAEVPIATASQELPLTQKPIIALSGGGVTGQNMVCK